MGKQSASDPQMRKQGEKMAKDIFDNCYSAPSFDPNLILTKTSSPNLQQKPQSFLTNRATGQKEQSNEAKATGQKEQSNEAKATGVSTDRHPKVELISSSRKHSVAKPGSNTAVRSLIDIIPISIQSLSF